MSNLLARRVQLLLPATIVASAIVLYSIDVHYPVREWLLSRTLQYWILAVYWAAGCLSTGLEILSHVAKGRYRVTEAPFIAFPLGVLAFGIATFAVGLGGGIGRVYFGAVPAIFFAFGFSTLRQTTQRFVQIARESRYRPSWIELGALGILAAGLVAVYVPILTPKNLQHDARWYHLPIAAQYVATGRIGAFKEGWILGAYPHLTSLVYTWALAWPAGIVHRVELCAHLEFVVFLMTIAATPALVRRIVPGIRLPFAAAAFFLFPGFLVYDSNLSVGADHFAALFAPGGLLLLFPALGTLNPRLIALVGAMAAGAALTKYSAVCVVVPLLVVVALRAALVLVFASRTRAAVDRAARALALRKKAGVAVLALLSSFVVLWSPHWLKNYVFYGDPLYPILHDKLALHPWDSQASFAFKVFIERSILRPEGGFDGVLESLWAASTLGLKVNEYGFHGTVPTFGFLFAGTLYCLPFVAAGRRVWTVYGMGWLAGLVWYATNHRDRYLQACLPWLVAGTISVLAIAWNRHGPKGRVGAALLVVVQLACGAGLWLVPAHNMANNATSLPDVIELVGAGYHQRYKERFYPDETWAFAAWTDVGRAIPKKSRVLVHEDRLWLGLDRAVVIDEAGWQAGIRYGKAKTPADVWDILKKQGITHIVTGRSHADGGTHGMAADLVFWDFVTTYARRLRDSRKLVAWAMPEARPPEAPLGEAAILTCNQSQPLGVYAFDGIKPRSPLRPVSPDKESFDAAFAQVTYVVNELGCNDLPPIDDKVLPAFRFMGSRLNVGYWKRR